MSYAEIRVFCCESTASIRSIHSLGSRHWQTIVFYQKRTTGTALRSLASSMPQTSFLDGKQAIQNQIRCLTKYHRIICREFVVSGLMNVAFEFHRYFAYWHRIYCAQTHSSLTSFPRTCTSPYGRMSFALTNAFSQLGTRIGVCVRYAIVLCTIAMHRGKKIICRFAFIVSSNNV